MKKNEKFFYDPDKLYRYDVYHYVDDNNKFKGVFYARNIEEAVEIIKKHVKVGTIRPTETYEREVLL